MYKIKSNSNKHKKNFVINKFTKINNYKNEFFYKL